jgi:hypothetical protein
MPSMCRPSPRLKADDNDVSASTVVNHAVGSILACGRWRARAGASGCGGSAVRMGPEGHAFREKCFSGY